VVIELKRTEDGGQAEGLLSADAAVLMLHHREAAYPPLLGGAADVARGHWVSRISHPLINGVAQVYSFQG